MGESCVSCGIDRSKLTETPWWHPDGFKCKPCKERERLADLADAMEKFKEEEYSDLDFQFNDCIKCPYCGTEYEYDSEDCGLNEDERECNLCLNTYIVTAEHSVSFSTKKKN